MPRKPKPDTIRDVSRDRSAALLQLDLSSDQVAAVPQITPILRKSGVLMNLWQYLEGSDNPDVRELLVHRAALSEHQRHAVPIEALCLAANISTKKALELITSAVYEQSHLSSQLLAAVAHPDVVEASVNAALLPGGTKDREMLLKHSGFLPVPKTSIVSVRGNHAIVGQQTNVVAVLPPVEDTIRNISNRFAERLPEAEPIDIEAQEDIEEFAEEDEDDE